jgi:hypothetical protein
MRKKTLWLTARIIAVLVIAAGIGARPQDSPPPVHLSGLINDYTAQTGSNPTVGPWEMRGVWSLNLKGVSGKADFSAAITMEESDYWLRENGEDPTQDPFVRGQHTHHITMTDAAVSYDTSSCPVDSPATTGRFMVTGYATITGNGNVASFQKKSGLSMLQVCITGGTVVPFSNVTLKFASMSPATTHFGSQAIHGVVH